MKMPLRSLVPVSCLSLAACGGPDVAVDSVDARDQSRDVVEGDADQRTQVDDVAVEEANVDVDSDVDASVSVDVSFGGEEEEEEDDVAGGVAAVGDGVSFDAVYQWPFDERLLITPRVEVGLDVVAVSFSVRAPRFDAPTIFDDAAGFAWGEADAGEDWLLATRFDGDSAPFAWTTETVLCDDDGCAGRSIAAVCDAAVVLTVTLADGSAREAVGRHKSSRVTCPRD